MKCPHCNKAAYPIKDDNGKVIWKNVFRTDIVSLLFFCSIILLLIGFSQVNGQCFNIVENPCEYVSYEKCVAEKYAPLEVNNYETNYLQKNNTESYQE